ncbi:MAG: hypothetical protein ACLP05_06120 [Candidatus Kryptoniota bacterium]
MKCVDVVVNLPDYILDKVEPNLLKCMGAHFDICEKCRSELEEMRDSIAILGTVAQEEYEDAFWQELRGVIMEKISSIRPVRWRTPAFAGGLAAFVLVVGFGVYEYALKPVTAPNERAESVAALAYSIPAYDIAELPNLNMNYVDAAAPQVADVDEINSVDDSTQQAVVKSMWAVSLADSVAAIDYSDYPGNVISN